MGEALPHLPQWKNRHCEINYHQYKNYIMKHSGRMKLRHFEIASVLVTSYGWQYIIRSWRCPAICCIFPCCGSKSCKDIFDIDTHSNQLLKMCHNYEYIQTVGTYIVASRLIIPITAAHVNPGLVVTGHRTYGCHGAVPRKFLIVPTISIVYLRSIWFQRPLGASSQQI